jgi:anti-anti-sigma factor
VIPGEDCLRLIGELDLAGVPALRACLAERHEGNVVVDCSGLTFIDCAGLGALVGAHQDRARAGAQLTVLAPSHCLRRLLELTGADELLTVQATSGEA